MLADARPTSRLLDTAGFSQLARTADGYLLYNTNDVYIGQAIARYGEYSAIELGVLKRVCGPGDVVIEVGANIGAHTVALARHVGPTGRVFAFEPQRLVFQTLCANIALNSLTNVECHWAALGAERGTVQVPELDPRQQGNFGGLTLLGDQRGVKVDCQVLDRYVSLPRLRLVKIDVEGMEADVISGGRQLIAKFKPVLYLENDRAEKSEALIRLIAGLGYRLYWHLPPLFNPDNFYGERENLFPNVVSINMLCVHPDAGIALEGFEAIADPAAHPLRPKSA